MATFNLKEGGTVDVTIEERPMLINISGDTLILMQDKTPAIVTEDLDTVLTDLS